MQKVGILLKLLPLNVRETSGLHVTMHGERNGIQSNLQKGWKYIILLTGIYRFDGVMHNLMVICDYWQPANELFWDMINLILNGWKHSDYINYINYIVAQIRMLFSLLLTLNKNKKTSDELNNECLSLANLTKQFAYWIVACNFSTLVFDRQQAGSWNLSYSVYRWADTQLCSNWIYMNHHIGITNYKTRCTLSHIVRGKVDGVITTVQSTYSWFATLSTESKESSRATLPVCCWSTYLYYDVEVSKDVFLPIL